MSRRDYPLVPPGVRYDPAVGTKTPEPPVDLTRRVLTREDEIRLRTLDIASRTHSRADNRPLLAVADEFARYVLEGQVPVPAAPATPEGTEQA